MFSATRPPTMPCLSREIHLSNICFIQSRCCVGSCASTRLPADATACRKMTWANLVDIRVKVTSMSDGPMEWREQDDTLRRRCTLSGMGRVRE
ncbi:hypothetical protein PoB_006296700 [Plakobranchus ocellatus]|uniref:Uncharacterized protein n=1 Tax=Plakobranchus ocellatus TaxID=259542 RepID=A0AAV4CX25_9GAST|nr:hypothetical protein PoB_006296700 [Plakobranchus ocellatus]